MQIDRQQVVNPCRHHHVGNQFGGNRHPGRTHPPILSRIAEIRNHRDHLAGRRAPERIGHDEHFHQVIVGRNAGGLDQEDIAAANIVLNLDRDFAIAKAADRGLAERNHEMVGDGLGQHAVCGARKNHEPGAIQARRLPFKRHRHSRVGRAPARGWNGCHDNWLGRQDSNLGMRGSKPRALPLGYAPIFPSNPAPDPAGPHADKTRCRAE